jgi:hypothetical protein
MRTRADFESLFTRTEGCWLWQGRVDAAGYGRIWLDTYAHREAWERANGPIPPGLTIDHICEVKTCVNPAHLQVVTRGENCALARLRRTHCPKGHPYDEANTYRWSGNGNRQCRTCRRERHRT